jgi:hypothetical protein
MPLYESFDDFKLGNGYVIDGIWYPRVTSICSIKAKPALYAYYANMPSFQVGEAIMNRSAQEGTLVHSIVEAILKEEPITIPSSIQPSIDAFLAFKQEHDIVPLKIEERIISKKHHYAGTIDVLAEVDGVVGVLDIKTSQAIYRDHGMQTAAYVEALAEDPSLPPLTSWILRLDQYQTCVRCAATMRQKGGNTKIRKEKYPCEHEWAPTQGEFQFKELTDFDSNIKGFLAAKSLWEWEHANHLAKIHPKPELI